MIVPVAPPIFKTGSNESLYNFIESGVDADIYCELAYVNPPLSDFTDHVDAKNKKNVKVILTIICLITHARPDINDLGNAVSDYSNNYIVYEGSCVESVGGRSQNLINESILYYVFCVL